MDTQETLSKSHELPLPTSEAASAGSASPEMGQSHEQQAVAGSSSAPTAATFTDPAQQATTDPQAPTIVAASSQLSAQDADLIEKEWVLKAKEIVARTHGDPYEQNSEINKIKADYIKKRYNKDIKQIAD